MSNVLHIMPTWHQDYVRIFTMPEELPIILAELEDGRIIKRDVLFAAMSHPSLRSRYSDIIYHTDSFESQTV
jgi:hypothetical protein